MNPHGRTGKSLPVKKKKKQPWHCCDGVEMKQSSSVMLLVFSGQTPQHPGWFNRSSLLPVQGLKEWVAVESDSVQPDLRKEVIRMMTLAADRLAALGATVNLVNLGSHQVPLSFLCLKHCICAHTSWSTYYIQRYIYAYVCYDLLMFLVAR